MGKMEKKFWGKIGKNYFAFDNIPIFKGIFGTVIVILINVFVLLNLYLYKI